MSSCLGLFEKVWPTTPPRRCVGTTTILASPWALSSHVRSGRGREILGFKAELPKDDQLVAEIIPKMKRGDLKGVSIGYKAIEKETRRSDGARLLKKINLVEISICPRPMNVQAQIESVKSFNPAHLDVVERALQEAAREMQSIARRVRGR